MTTQPDDQPGGLTRRQIIAGAGAAAAGAAVLGTTLTAGAAGAAAPQAFPQAIDPSMTGLTYIGIDAVGIRTAPSTPGWYSDDFSGTGANSAGFPLTAPLTLPAGAVVKHIKVAYQGTGAPTVFIYERPLATPRNPQAFVNTALPNQGSGPHTHSFTTTLPIKHDHTYAFRVNVSPGDSLFGIIVGYTPSAFSPFAGAPAAARVLDTRLAGGKFSAGEERVLDLSGASPVGSAVVLNLTADQPEGTGFLSAYSGDIAFPNTSALNYSTATPNIANTTTVVLGAGNKIKIRCGEASTHVIVDVVGYLL
jgi:hypothetical protein